MNEVRLIGRLTKDPDIKNLKMKNGDPFTVATFVIAVDNGKGKKATFLLMKAFNKNAEFAQKYLNKGMKMLFYSHLTQSMFVDSEGKTNSRIEIQVDKYEFLEPRKSISVSEEEVEDVMDVPELDTPFN